MSVPALANEQRGKHDAVLDFFIEKHGSDAELVVDTIVDLLKRRGLLSPDEFTSGLTQQGYLSAWHRHVAGALDQPPPLGSAAGGPASDSEPAAAAGPAATVTDDLVELPVTMAPSAQKALDKAKAEAAARAGGAEGSSAEIKVGTQCKANGCEACYCAPPAAGESARRASLAARCAHSLMSLSQRARRA